MDKKIWRYVLKSLLILGFVIVTALLGWHDAQSILPPAKRIDFAMSVTSIQLGIILGSIYSHFKNRKNPKRLSRSPSLSSAISIFPFALLFMLSWYLDFWPGPYR